MTSNGQKIAVKEKAAASADQTTRILTADLLIADELIALPAGAELARAAPGMRDRYARLDGVLHKILSKKGAATGDKISIDAEDFKELALAAAGLPSKREAGGSTADILTTVKHLLGDGAEIDFLGVVGADDVHDALITEDLRRSGIRLDPGPFQGARSARSFIFTYADGKRTCVTYPGNAAEKLNAEMVTDERVARSDAVFLPISLWSKFDDTLPEALLRSGFRQDKQIIVSMPKQARFYEGEPGDIHKRLIPSADVIVADEAELARWYETGGDGERAIRHLQAEMARRDGLRAAAGKPPRRNPAVALVKHANDSATLLVAASPDGAPAARYEMPVPPAISGKKHTLGVDDAMYAGFIAALSRDVPPRKAAEFAMDVAQTKFLYDSVRIPSPVGADTTTRKRWNDLRSGLDDALAELESAIGYAKTGVDNPVDSTLPRTRGQKAFDFILYPLLANIGVFALSTFVTYHSNFNQNKANPFVKRSSWFKDQLTKVPVLAENPKMARNLNMIVWSFLDGSLMAPVVAAFESKRQPISRWIDEKLDSVPEDASVYDKEVQRSWQDVIKARAATFALVMATYFTFNAKTFPHSAQKGILAEVSPGSGVFERETVESINGFVFDIPGKKIGGWLTRIPSVRNWAQKLSDNQLKNMAERTGTAARKATPMDARYQIEGLVNTGLFEIVYTSLCTAGLFFIGKAFAARRKNAEASADDSTHHSTNDKHPGAVIYPGAEEQPGEQSFWAEKAPARLRLEKSGDHQQALAKSRVEAPQVGV
ncbi:MAG: carbohydrate kinase family protein [Alphaproteobacteria bacterium]|nr:carbohydrate kinase family protein [Alphaproteobacteria bacterium]